MNTRMVLLAVGLVGGALFTGSAANAAIMKCQDAQGNWHYGDHAAAACRKTRAKVMELSTQTGHETVMKSAPTKAELKQRADEKAAAEAKKKKQAEQAREDKILRDSYATEQDIIFERDRKLKELQDSIDANESTVKSLKAVLARSEQRVAEEKKRGKVSKNSQKTLEFSRKQVEEHEASLVDLRKQLVETRKKYDENLERYRDMKRREAAGATASTR
jgi:predicted RNase H-like nuclease (RuvC/YqgF family)